jgi:hypothetical protein
MSGPGKTIERANARSALLRSLGAIDNQSCSMPRRRWLGTCLVGASIALCAGQTARANEEPIAQPDRATPEAFMARAFAMRDRASRDGDQPYGAEPRGLA